MTGDYYSFEVSGDALRFEFDSVGPRGIIRKAVLYTPLPPNPSVYNLGFGDVQGDKTIDDKTVSNNGDMEVVLTTVVQTLFHFFMVRPENAVAFTGSTEARTRLYQILIAKSFENAAQLFYLFGIRNGAVEEFVLGTNYDAFLLYKRI